MSGVRTLSRSLRIVQLLGVFLHHDLVLQNVSEFFTASAGVSDVPLSVLQAGLLGKR